MLTNATALPAGWTRSGTLVRSSGLPACLLHAQAHPRPIDLGFGHNAAWPEVLRTFHDNSHPWGYGVSFYYRKPILDQIYIDRNRTYLIIVTDYVKKSSLGTILYRLNRNGERAHQRARRERHRDEHAGPEMSVRIGKLCFETNCAACRIYRIIDKSKPPCSRLFPHAPSSHNHRYFAFGARLLQRHELALRQSEIDIDRIDLRDAH